jgi:hypothetical protein
MDRDSSPPADYAAIARRAPSAVTARARQYLQAGAVSVRPARSVITGQVGPQAVAAYIVAPNGVPAWSCECGAVGSLYAPDQDPPCEHVVALVLAWLADEDTQVAIPRRPR